MKKNSVLLAILMIFSLFLLSACGVSGSRQVVGVSFSSSRFVEYENQQVKCFLLDEGENFKLPYSIYPNTATAEANIVFSNNAAEINATAATTFSFSENGVITINNGNSYPSEGLLVTIIVNGDYTDKCLIKKVNFPDANLKDSESATINQNGLHVFSVVDNENNKIDNAIYNFKLISSDVSVIQVANDNALAVKSTGKRGYAKITVSFVTDGGKTKAIGECTLSVLMNASSKQFLVNGVDITSYDINNTNSSVELVFTTSNQELSVLVLLVDAAGEIINGFVTKVQIIQGQSIEVSGDKRDKIKVKNIEGFISESCIIEITTDVYDLDGNLVKLRFKANAKKV